MLKAGGLGSEMLLMVAHGGLVQPVESTFTLLKASPFTAKEKVLAEGKNGNESWAVIGMTSVSSS